VYVYNYRGEVRYKNLREYLRKAWPIFAPLNCFLYVSTKRNYRKPIVNIDDFAELQSLTDKWELVREEAESLREQGYFEKTTKEGSASYYDVGFRTFYKHGWSKFYVNWYGYTHESAKKLCPNTVELLKNIPSVNGAMFTLLPPGSELTRHCDPIACSYRYQLGLSTPNSDACFINIDGKSYSWRDGEAFCFDETYIHYVNNNTEDYRLILMFDVERPMNIFGRGINWVYKLLARATLVPNTSIDRQGFFNRLFSTVTPFLEWSKAFKKRNRPLYKRLQFVFNSLLLLILLLIIATPFIIFS
ncbi:aspartyl/asparaginyl beta-hydroxylase, partial [Oleiphilus sp. HI0078]